MNILRVDNSGSNDHCIVEITSLSARRDLEEMEDVVNSQPGDYEGLASNNVEMARDQPILDNSTRFAWEVKL